MYKERQRKGRRTKKRQGFRDLSACFRSDVQMKARITFRFRNLF